MLLYRALEGSGSGCEDVKKMSETVIIGWKAIAAMFGCSERKIRNYRHELTNLGVIFYMNLGRPPRKRVCAFPTTLKRWTALKALKGEII